MRWRGKREREWRLGALRDAPPRDEVKLGPVRSGRGWHSLYNYYFYYIILHIENGKHY